MKLKSFVYLLALLLSVHAVATAQSDSKKPSPAAVAKGTAGGSEITINYSSPAVKGREIWGKLVPYNEVWRAGANEATTFKTTKDILVEGKALPAGEYSFFAIPTPTEWTLIFNKTAKQWGASSYSEKEDALRVLVKARKSSALSERLKYTIEADKLILSWEKLDIPARISAK